MKRIFFDTNIILDLMEKDAEDHIVALYLHDILYTKGRKMLCSPTTVCIAYYYFEKFYKQKKNIKTRLTELFSSFEFTSENDQIVKAAFNSAFTDVEDAVQYFSALDSKADVIITKNVFDYINPVIEVINPELFIELYL